MSQTSIPQGVHSSPAAEICVGAHKMVEIPQDSETFGSFLDQQTFHAGTMSMPHIFNTFNSLNLCLFPHL
jgi:hypothetical protein